MGSERTYCLEVAVQPPSVAKAGSPFYPPLVVLVRIYDDNGCEVSGEDELSGLFAQATLYKESGSPPPLAPPDMYLLSGRLSASLELLNEPGAPSVGSSWSQRKGSYVMFPDLTINRPGKYRLGVSLFKVGGRGRLRSPFSAANGGIGGGTTLEEAKTNVISVQEDVGAVQIEPAVQELLNHLERQGANIPSPPRC